MTEQGFNYVDSTIREMTDFFETREENLEPKEEEKKSSAAAKKFNNKKSAKKLKREDSDSSVVESREDSSVERWSNKKYCILHGTSSHSTDNCKDVNDQQAKAKKKMSFKT